MALETLKNVEKIGDFEISRDIHDWEVDKNVVIDDTYNIIGFKLQKGPIKEVGVNGCQVDTIIEAAKLIIEGLNAQFPCAENSEAIDSLNNALHWLNKRRENREKRGVEGYNKN
jgi:hypothetical protein